MTSPSPTHSAFPESSPSTDSDVSLYSDEDQPRMEMSSRGGTPASAAKIDGSRKRSTPSTRIKKLILPMPSDPLGAPRTTGSEDDPHVIHVDMKFPERNREFDIERIQRMEDKAVLVNGFLIRKTIPPPDANHWKAYVPTRPKHLKKRAIMVKGPSRNYWYKDKANCKDSTNPCIATETALLATVLDINDAPERKNTHWLLVFPQDITFDGSRFRCDDDTDELQCHYVPLVATPDEMGGKLKLYSMNIYWRVAEKAGGRRFKEGHSAPDVKSMFAGK